MNASGYKKSLGPYKYLNGAFAIERGETAGKNQIYFYMPKYVF